MALDGDRLLEGRAVDPRDSRLGDRADRAETDLVVRGRRLAAVELGVRVVLERVAQRVEQRGCGTRPDFPCPQ